MPKKPQISFTVDDLVYERAEVVARVQGGRSIASIAREALVRKIEEFEAERGTLASSIDGIGGGGHGH